MGYHRDTFHEGKRAFHIGGVRVRLRHDIETRHKRPMLLELHAREKTFVLSDAQIQPLERHSSDFRSRHVETSRPGEPLNQDTFYCER